jgi:K+-sensing histidine kinase KdpD
LAQIARLGSEAVIGCFAIGATAAICYQLHLDLAAPSCLFLLVVIVQSTRTTFTSVAVVSAFSSLCLNYFFVPPIFTLNIDNPADGFH